MCVGGVVGIRVFGEEEWGQCSVCRVCGVRWIFLECDANVNVHEL